MKSDELQVEGVTAKNATAYTLEGTNTWLIHANAEAVVIDPGPDSAEHLGLINNKCLELGLKIRTVIVTHAHDDHLGNLWRMVHRDPELEVHSIFHSYPAEVSVGQHKLSLLPTPGHTADSVTVWHAPTGALFTGDTILGRGSTMIDFPDGSVTDYIASVKELAKLPGLIRLYPGHGEVRLDPYEALRWNIKHRNARIEEIRSAISVRPELEHDLDQLLRECYPRVSAELRAAARQNVAASLEHIRTFAELDN